MNRLTSTLVAVALTLGVTAAGQEKAPPVINGTWVMTLDMSQGVASPEIELKQDGEKLTGTYRGRYGTFEVTGKIRGRLFEFSFLMNEEHPVSMCFNGEISPDAKLLKGTAVLAEMGEATWTAAREEKKK